MQVQKTIKLKVGELRRGKQELIDLALLNSLNATKDFIDLSIKNKTTSKTRLHQIGYKEVKEKYDLPSCIIAQSREKASGIVKAWKSNKRKLHKNIPKPEPKALRIRYNNIIFNVIKTESKKFQFWASILIKAGYKRDKSRIYLPLIVNSDWQKNYLNDLMNKKYKKGSADLVKKGEEYFVHIVLKKEVEFKPKKKYNPIGIDVGINNLAVININGKSKFFSGKRAITTKKHFNQVKALYQSRGNKKILEAIKGKEQRYFNHINNEISSWIVENAKQIKNPIIVMEDLARIIQQTKVRKKQRYIHQTWAFRKLQDMIQYKAVWSNIPVVYIQPQYTSQVCPKCLSTNKRKKHDYKCKHCGYEANSDHVGAVNIRKKFLEGISFQDSAPINRAVGFSFCEPKVIEEEAQKCVIRKEDVPLLIT